MKSETSEKAVFRALNSVLSEAAGSVSVAEEDPAEGYKNDDLHTGSSGQPAEMSFSLTLTDEKTMPGTAEGTESGIPSPVPFESLSPYEQHMTGGEIQSSASHIPEDEASSVIADTSSPPSVPTGMPSSGPGASLHRGGNATGMEQEFASLEAFPAGAPAENNWQEEMLLLLPELHELTDRGNFMAGGSHNEMPELHDIQERLSEAGVQLERIGNLIDKLEQEYRT